MWDSPPSDVEDAAGPTPDLPELGSDSAEEVSGEPVSDVVVHPEPVGVVAPTPASGPEETLDFGKQLSALADRKSRAPTPQGA